LKGLCIDFPGKLFYILQKSKFVFIYFKIKLSIFVYSFVVGIRKRSVLMKRKTKYIIAILIICALIFGGCGDKTDKGDAPDKGKPDLPQQSVDISATPDATFESVLGEDELFGDVPDEIVYNPDEIVEILLKNTEIVCDSNVVTVDGCRAVICAGGTYVVSGSLDNGMIIVEAAKQDVNIVLKNASVTSKTSAALYVRKAAEVTVSLDELSRNVLKNGGTYTAIDENNIDSVIFSKGDLVFTGSGTLDIDASAGHGIVSKDTLSIVNGKYNIEAASHGIAGKDSVNIGGGEFNIKSGKDAVHAENSDDTTLGYMCITGGKFTLDTEGDGISASAYMQISGGEFNITTGSGSKNATSNGGDSFGGRNPWGDSSQVETDTVSTKGVKAGGNLVITSGVFSIDSQDDAIHSNSNITIENCTAEIKSGDDGVHCDNAFIVKGGTLKIEQSYEGLEGLTIDISGGTVSVTASDDGLNAAGGNDASGFGGMGGAFDADGSAYIKFTGGTVNVNASGDGIDSNGSIIVSGGAVYVSGPTNSGNGAFDYGTSAVATGGICIAAGSSGMAAGFGNSSTQGAMLLNVGNQSAGSKITVSDSNGKVLAEYSPEKIYSSVVITCPGLSVGGNYTVTAGSYSQNITLSSIVYGASGGMGGGVPGGGMPGGGGRPGGNRYW